MLFYFKRSELPVAMLSFVFSILGGWAALALVYSLDQTKGRTLSQGISSKQRVLNIRSLVSIVFLYLIDSSDVLRHSF
jgi:hypothetical protein